MTDGLRALAGQKTILLTSFRRDGSPVATPVSLAFDGDRAFFRTWDVSGKAKRLRRNPDVEVAPATFRGAATGPAIRLRARLLSASHAPVARRALARRHPVLHRFIIPLAHRLMRYRTIHFELLPPA